tara:strand:+ start:31 stop:360 length:330 start_codon:yes stop_codon:yes gene_type:complete
MTVEEQVELEKAYRFSMGLRGRYIIAQALHHAIKLMEHVPSPHTEISDIGDMKYLRDTLYNTFPDTLLADTSTSKHWQYMTDVVGSGKCSHVVANCETDQTCECGGVYV